MTDNVLAQALVYLAIAAIFVPIAKRLGLGPVLGYLIAGAVIGPWGLGVVGTEGHHVMHFAELGVVMMLFLVGLELQPARLWALRGPIFGLGSAQVVVTAAVCAGIALLLGVAWRPALVSGFVLAMSSTAIVIASLTERGLLRTAGGQSAFAVLLFQDLSVIPILALLPLLGTSAAASGGGRAAWVSALLIAGAVIAVIAFGRFVVRPVFRLLAATRLRESFTAASLMIIVGIALLMQTVGLSPALGTFLAGVVLADSEYRHELESDIEPFKGMLLGLFFISVGAQLDFGLIARAPLVIAGLVAGTMAVKLVVLHGIGRAFGLDRSDRWLVAISLAQIGEFAFVMLSFGVQAGVFDQAYASPFVAAVAISMVLTPPAFSLLERVVLPRVAEPRAQRPQDEIHHADTPVVIAGYGRYGQIVGRILRANAIPMTILDLDPDIVDLLARLGIKVYYGDASRPDLLEAAGCARAKLFVLAVDDAGEATKIAETVRQHYPNLTVLARSRDRPHYWELRRLGIKRVFRETFGSAYETGIAALEALGYRAHTAYRLGLRWRAHEEQLLEELADVWGSNREDYLDRTRTAMDEAERLMRQEAPGPGVQHGAAWDDSGRRAEAEAEEEQSSR